MKPITRPLTRAHLLQLTQSKDNGSSSSCNGSTVLQNIQSQVYNLAWSLNRIGDAGRVILQKENLILVGPNDVRSTIPLDLSTAADELAFWRAKLRCLEAHKSMIRLRRIKGWVYKAMTGLWRLGSDGRSVLQQAGLSFAGYGEVHYDPQPGDPETYDNLTFWETKLQHIEEEYALLKEPAKSSLHVLEFVSSGSEAEEQTEYLRAEDLCKSLRFLIPPLEKIKRWVSRGNSRLESGIKMVGPWQRRNASHILNHKGRLQGNVKAVTSQR
ncbi:hypothetical protein CGMCC3_g9850 [Colletotrichum fructicola]|nr:uncharacterized protein CGMCC3_g9850 [Colletotrichum fructicola]KAE9574204.1 hypothetical protein CGMCC3_g9850 [Colletotrichum fructicola]